jgi:outer membrane protein assembly factor BamE (lipoprotein component of BamABCDE complex)
MNKLLIIASMLILTGCKITDSRGQYVDDQEVQALENKSLTKDDVTNLIGLPTLVPDYTPDTWYYASRSLERKIFTQPKVVSQRIVKVTFIKDRLDMVEVLDDKHEGGIKVVQEYTRSLGTNENAMQRFVKNFGRFNSTKKKTHR